MKKGSEVFEQAKSKARRVYVQLDSEYDISSKTAKAARKAEEAARDLDQQYGLRRRFRAAREDLARNWPAWQRQLDEFTQTTPGKITVFAGLCLLISTPVFWQLLNVVLLLWWLTVPLSLFVLNAAANQQAEQIRQQQQAEAEAEARRRANPFAEMFREAGAAFGGAAAGSGGAGGSSSRGSGYVQQDGPVIEAEWTSLDDEGNPKGGSKGGRR
ncbi:hypothetical protein HYH02_008537 [Chlamydomonas schloesseri]|uniref:Uncharacterized protein n=1 Tax=Chlamydomonas schloesseri TaxID=2026947 RepID=A0A835WGF9_9CHLO|nr:hypothetical protein HYH02_008537 [Chlamydomonas schloesseri]|eukprot:KAG2446550.1 hypothetical protein HYH02_008537 [Chlamydomonas schloesseri]